MLEVQSRLTGELKTLRGQVSAVPHYCDFYLQKPHHVLTMKIKENSSLLLLAGGRGSNHSEIL
jgi:hypothetical protein